ncbi:MAG TPA: hypothetical protein VGG46_13795 [Terriglobales bacterium]|jgi:uncharacterized protein (DUF1778 family)
MAQVLTEAKRNRLNEEKRSAVLILAERSRKVFVEAILNPSDPNEKALAAAKRFTREVR